MVEAKFVKRVKEDVDELVRRIMATTTDERIRNLAERMYDAVIDLFRSYDIISIVARYVEFVVYGNILAVYMPGVTADIRDIVFDLWNYVKYKLEQLCKQTI